MPRGRPKSQVAPCRFCKKEFKRLEHLQRHERIHTREKPFVCQYGRPFSRQDLLIRHERLCHSPAGVEEPTTANEANHPQLNNNTPKVQIQYIGLTPGPHTSFGESPSYNRSAVEP
ncbi:hypothetical protein N7501_000167 [Penicillium viridicatum]|nr:hypothetical protein N7501_000167 [Penicillium viridicatum]